MYTLEATGSKVVTGAGVPEFNMITILLGISIILIGIVIKNRK